MTVGIQVTRSQVDSAVGEAARTLRRAFDQVADLKEWLDTQTDSDLGGFGYDEGEIPVLRSALGDLDRLRLVFQGDLEQTPAYDFRRFARQLWGLG